MSASVTEMTRKFRDWRCHGNRFLCRLQACGPFVFFQRITMPADKDVTLRKIGVGRQWPWVLTWPPPEPHCPGRSAEDSKRLLQYVSVLIEFEERSPQGLFKITHCGEMWHVTNCVEKDTVRLLVFDECGTRRTAAQKKKKKTEKSTVLLSWIQSLQPLN